MIKFLRYFISKKYRKHFSNELVRRFNDIEQKTAKAYELK